MHKRLAASLLAAALLLPGCVVPGPVNEAEDARFGALSDDIQRLKREMSEMRGGQTGAAAAPDREAGKKLADLEERIRQTDLDMQAQKGRIEEMERALSETRTAARGEKVGPEVAAISDKVASLSDKVVNLSKSMDALNAGAGKAGTAGAGTPAVAQKGPKDLYDEAYALYRDGKYTEAQTRFREYVERFPDTPLTDNAIFWIGESYYDQGQYEQAILQYDKVVQKYPGGDKVASSLLKQAFSFAAMGDNLDARILLKKVIQEHAGSEQANIAKKKLEVLGE